MNQHFAIAAPVTGSVVMPSSSCFGGDEEIEAKRLASEELLVVVKMLLSLAVTGEVRLLGVVGKLVRVRVLLVLVLAGEMDGAVSFGGGAGGVVLSWSSSLSESGVTYWNGRGSG